MSTYYLFFSSEAKKIVLLLHLHSAVHLLPSMETAAGQTCRAINFRIRKFYLAFDFMLLTHLFLNHVPGAFVNFMELTRCVFN
jgi:hypothetical protein